MDMNLQLDTFIHRFILVGLSTLEICHQLSFANKKKKHEEASIQPLVVSKKMGVSPGIVSG